MLTDAHTHIADVRVLDILKQFNIYSLVCAMDPKECEKVKAWSQQHKQVIPTYGIHPWNSEKFSAKDIKNYLEEAPVIGEIGLDKPWCKVPFDIQEKVFIEHLEIAQRRNIPVILHTKGREKEVADITKNFRIPILVHWYHCDHWLENYLEQDCYFTIGPDCRKIASIQELAKVVPINRLLVETDGVESIAWIRKQPAAPEDVPIVLKDTLAFVAELRGLEKERLRVQVNENFSAFCRRRLP